MCNLHISFGHCAVNKNVHIAHMIRVLDALLAPIARLCVARGVLFPQVAESFKRQMVLAAADRIGAKATDSRVSVMTGLQRRDIARIRREREPAPLPVNHLARLVAAWVAQGGNPLSRAEFDVLARAIRQDVHPATQLAQLVDAGTVATGVDDQVTLLTRGYQPLSGSEEQLDYLARNGADYLAAATDNVIQSKPPFFERAVHYNNLSAEAVDQLESIFREKQQALLEELNARAADLRPKAPGNARFRAGGYFYREDEGQ